MDVSKWAILVLAVLSTTIPMGEGCQCIPGSLNQFYEKASSVVKAYVVEVEYLYKQPNTGAQDITLTNFHPADRILYTLNLSAMLKGCGPESAIFTAVSKASYAECGIRFREGQIWMLNLGQSESLGETATGGEASAVPERRFLLNACQGHRLWNTLKPYELDFLQAESQKSENMCWQNSA